MTLTALPSQQTQRCDSWRLSVSCAPWSKLPWKHIWAVQLHGHKNHIWLHKECTQKFIESLFIIVQVSKQPKCPLKVSIWHILTVKCYSETMWQATYVQHGRSSKLVCWVHEAREQKMLSQTILFTWSSRANKTHVYQ